MKKWSSLLSVLLVLGFLWQMDPGSLAVDEAFVAVTNEEDVKVNPVRTGEERKVSRVAKIFRFFEGPREDVSVLAFGDMMLGRHVRILMEQNGFDYIFEGVSSEPGKFFVDADVVHANLEGPIVGTGKKGGTEMNFAFNEDVAPLLKSYGFDVLSIANNHAVDQGWDGRARTIEVLNEAEVGWCGNPAEAEMSSVYFDRVGKAEYAFVCLHSVNFPLDLDEARNLIRSVDDEVDYVFVSIHWGVEYQHTANKELQVEPARAFIDAGADFVIGHHPHVVQNFEVYNGRMIFYSLGNFVFDQYWAKKVQEELAIKITLQEDKGMQTKVELFPMKSEYSKSRLMTEEEKREWLERFIGYGSYTEDMQAMIRAGVIEIEGDM